MRQRRGFTLIELLVVIAIIAILAAILFPVFAQARDKARSAACLSNQKQFASALLMYMQDYDEKGLWFYNESDAKATKDWVSGYWYNPIMPYVKNLGVFMCPAVSRSKDGCEPDRKPRPLLNRCGFGINVAHAGYGTGDPYFRPGKVADTRPLAAYAEPARVIFLADSQLDPRKDAHLGWQDIKCPIPHKAPLSGDVDLWVNDKGSGGPNNPNITRRHQGGANAVFMDGHAKWYTYDAYLNQGPGKEIWGHWGSGTER
jgi:prepilin-type N-terminal cleavage/methylation domain-containing protein/prepilin-type processing-associated H-X9-DG protein